MYRIRAIKPSDLHSLKLSSKFTFDWKAEIGIHKDQHFLAMENKSKIIGLVEFVPLSENYRLDYIYLLEVCGAYRRQGIGRELVKGVVWDSFLRSFDGVVGLESKTNGVQDFYLALGGQWTNNRRILIDESAAKELLKSGGNQHDN